MGLRAGKLRVAQAGQLKVDRTTVAAKLGDTLEILAAPDRIAHNGSMVTLETLRSELREEVLRLALEHGARNLRVFGSVARGEATEGSDLDLLVEWEPNRSLLDHVGLVQDLEELLGVKVHLGTQASLHSYIRERILREATPL